MLASKAVTRPYWVTRMQNSGRALFNGLDRHCVAPFVRKRALLLVVGAFAPLSSLRSSIHPRIRLRGFLRAVSRFAVHYCENRSSVKILFLWYLRLIPGLLASGCIVTTQAGPGNPPQAAVEEHRTVKPIEAKDNLPTEIAARHLLVQYAGAQSAPPRVVRTKEEARKRAEEALQRAQSGEDFASLVAEYSDEPGAKERGGSLGRFQHHAMVRPFSEAAFHLKVGQLSGVVETPFGYHVIVRTE